MPAPPAPSPLAVTGRLQVTAGQDILPSWGNTTFDQTVECFASNTDRDTQWPTPHNGAMCYTDDTATVWVYLGGWKPLVGAGRAAYTGAGIGSYVDAYGDTWIAKAGVNSGAWRRPRDVLNARIWRNAAFNPPATETQYTWDSTSWDPYGISSATGFTVPVAGIYTARAVITANATAANQWYFCRLYQGATGRSTGQAVSYGAGGTLAVATDHLRCAAGDVISVYHRSSVALSGVTGENYNNFSVAYLGTG